MRTFESTPTGPLDLARKEFKDFIGKSLKSGSTTEAVVVFGSSIKNPNPNDIDFLVVTDEKFLNPDFLTAAWAHDHPKLPPLEFNGFVNISGKKITDPWGEEPQPVAVALFKEIKSGSKECVVICPSKIMKKYKDLFPGCEIDTV